MKEENLPPSQITIDSSSPVIVQQPAKPKKSLKTESVKEASNSSEHEEEVEVDEPKKKKRKISNGNVEEGETKEREKRDKYSRAAEKNLGVRLQHLVLASSLVLML